ncbi:MAG: hypothetical protein K0S56_1480, partial [Microvirga sp.]|nr:hypothetical protein [Microvirga sp.]
SAPPNMSSSIAAKSSRVGAAVEAIKSFVLVSSFSGQAVGSAGLGHRCRAGRMPPQHPYDRGGEGQDARNAKRALEVSSAPRLREPKLAGRCALLQSTSRSKDAVRARAGGRWPLRPGPTRREARACFRGVRARRMRVVSRRCDGEPRPGRWPFRSTPRSTGSWCRAARRRWRGPAARLSASCRVDRAHEYRRAPDRS